MVFTKFIYDLSGKPEPSISELDYELDRLFFIKGNIGEPNFLVDWDDDRDQIGPIDSEVITSWLTRKFEPTLVLMLLDSQQNYDRVKKELSLMGKYQTLLDKYLRASYIESRSKQRIKELLFDGNVNNLNLSKSIIELKKTLTLLSKYFETESPEHLTLLKTEAYSQADIILYNYLKRIIVGKYKDYGLRSHIKLCDHLVEFMKRYERKNVHIEPARESDKTEEPSLITDLAIPAAIGFAAILFFSWRIS